MNPNRSTAGQRYRATRRDRAVVWCANRVLRLATPAYRARLRRIVADGMAFGLDRSTLETRDDKE